MFNFSACKFVLLVALSLTFLTVISTEESANKKLRSELFSACLNVEGTDSSITYFERDNASSTYLDLNYQWNTRLGNIEPLGYFVPESTSDVQAGVRCGVQHNIRLVPKSGGHSYQKYSFGDSESIIVDLQLLNSVTVYANELTARVGAGTLIGPLYWELWRNGGFGIPTTMGTTPGISGVSMGGGYGIFTNRHGLTLDSILEVEIVDAQGVVRVANEKNDADLFWALRGAGGGNFGIVTNFKFQLFDASAYNVTSFGFEYKLESFEEAFKAWQNWNAGPAGRENLGLAFFDARPTNFGLWFVDIDLTTADIEAITSEFPTPDQTAVSVEYTNFIDRVVINAGVALESPEDLGTITRHNESMYPYRAKTYFCSKLLSDDDLALLKPWLVSVPQNVFVTIDSFHGRVNEIPSDATAWVHRDSLFLIYVGTSNPESDETTTAWLSGFDEVARRTLDNGESYQNAPDAELQDGEYLTRYYGSNLEKLVQVKKAVDPTDYFRFPQSIPTQL